MTTPAWSQNKKLRNQVLQLEEEVAFLRDRNNHIQRLGDNYRMKISQIIASIHARSSRDAGMTEDELSCLLHRLRSSDISFKSPALEELSAAKDEASPSPQRLLSREDDDGLMQSRSTVSHVSQKEEVSRSSKTQAKKQSVSAAERAQHAVIARLTTENKSLASLVDSLRVKLATAARLRVALEKRLRASKEIPRSSGGATAGVQHSPSEIQQKEHVIQNMNDQLHREKECARHFAREASHYKTLLERQTAKVEAAREALAQRDKEYINATESIRSLKASLRLSRLRETRAINAVSQMQSQQGQGEGHGEQTESRSSNGCCETSKTPENATEGLQAEALQTFTAEWAATLIGQHEFFQEQLLETYIAHITLSILSVAPGATLAEATRQLAVEAQRQVQDKIIVTTREKCQEDTEHTTLFPSEPSASVNEEHSDNEQYTNIPD